MDGTAREIFGNLQPWMRVLFYTMMMAGGGWLVWQYVGRARLWWQGRPGHGEQDWRSGVRRLLVYVLAQKRVWRQSLGGVLHLLLFSGFVVLTIGTTLLMIAHIGPVNFHVGWYYLIYELIMDVFGAVFVAGCLLALYRRLLRQHASLGHAWHDWMLLALLLAIATTGFALEALRIRYTQVAAEQGRWSVVGWAINLLLLPQTGVDTARALHLTVWWVHAALVAIWLAVMPVTRMRHVITGPLSIAVRPSRPMGALESVPLEQVEQTGCIGVSAIEHLTRQQLLSLDTCMECGRCEDACPAWATGKPLSPKKIVLNLRDLMERPGRALHGETIHPDTVWACTTCQACVQQCPILIGQVDLIADLRRHLVGEGQLTGPPAQALRRTGTQSNPYGRPSQDRLVWAEGLDVPTVEDKPDFDYLLWVGCAASFDPRAQKIARATAQLLRQAGVNFAVLGRHERCTGDPARRLGEELLFQQLAQQNVETLTYWKVKKVVTPCPHCFNCIAHEYRQFGGSFQVQHHTQLLAELVDAGRLEPLSVIGEPLTLHDPCYLARVNGELESPRKLTGATQENRENFRELGLHGKNTFCCGAGGGRIWFDEQLDQRVSQLRVQEVVESGATTLATACPFCLNMLTDGVAGVESGPRISVLDVSQLLINSQSTSSTSK